MNRRDFLNTSKRLTLTLALVGLAPVAAQAGNGKGKFKGDNNHTVSGGVKIENGTIILADNFSFDGAPDPRIGLGKAGRYSPNTDFAVLKKNQGAQTYKVPASINTDDYDTVIVWCRKYSVQLAHAKIR